MGRTARMVLVVQLCVGASLVGASSALDLFDPLRVVNGCPSWGGLRLGMTADEVRGEVAKEFALQRQESECGPTPSWSATVEYRKRSIELTFELGPEGVKKLEAIVVTRQPDDAGVAWGRSVLGGEVKRRLPGLTYKPSRHAPEIREDQAVAACYTLPSCPSILVVLEPGYRISIAGEELFD
ncbi:MAG: hypothetical protein LAO51_08890 [Acidobacteriia bacterium]|nr:hypothetical protein [Terriglobia bacterium]